MGIWTKPPEDMLTGDEIELWDRYPRHVVQAFFAVSYDDSMPILNGPPYEWPRDQYEVVAEAIKAFMQRWGDLSDETFVQVLTQAHDRDRLTAIFAIGFGPLPQAADLLVLWLASADVLERCAAAIVLGLRRDERALSVLEEYVLADEPIVEVKVPAPLVSIRRVQPEAEIWFGFYRAYIVGVLATWGPTSIVPVLRTAFLKYWAQEQEKLHPTYSLPDGLLYALGRRGAVAALHGIALPDLHQRLSMIYLALGVLRADERFDDLYSEMITNRELQQEVASICTTQFGISAQEAQQYMRQFSSDDQKRRKNPGYRIIDVDGFMRGDPNSMIKRDEI